MQKDYNVLKLHSPNVNRSITMTEEEVERIVSRALSKELEQRDLLSREDVQLLFDASLSKALLALGVDSANPVEWQKRMSFLGDLMARDRSLRSNIKTAFVTAGISGVIAYFLGGGANPFK